ncbi:MAG: phosphatase PAP2 family protein [Bacilli bacterium]
MEKWYKQYIIATTSILLILGLCTYVKMFDKFDDTINDWIFIHSPEWLREMMSAVTHAADGFFLFWFIPVASLFLMMCYGSARRGIHFCILAIACECMVLLTKWAFVRPRPDNQLVLAEGYSFVSGHSALAMCVYGMLILSVFELSKNRWVRYLALWCGGSLIFLIGVSRIVLHVHYVTDIVAGWLLGSIFLVIYLLFLKKNWLDRWLSYE